MVERLDVMDAAFECGRRSGDHLTPFRGFGDRGSGALGGEEGVKNRLAALTGNRFEGYASVTENRVNHCCVPFSKTVKQRQCRSVSSKRDPTREREFLGVNF